MLTSLARELVMNRGVGESADAVWRQLRAQSGVVHRADDPEPMAEPVPAALPRRQSSSDLVFGQTINPERKRSPAHMPVEQLELF